MIKVKHARTADCVVAGFRWHKAGKNELVGSLLLGLYDEHGRLHHVGVTSSFTMAMRRELARSSRRCGSARSTTIPGASGPRRAARETTRMPGGQSRWSAGKDLSWEPLRIERVCEVKYDHMQGDRFRHAAVFQRWRPDKLPGDCRYDQLEVTTPYELEKVFGAVARALADAAPIAGHVVVGIERFLRRPQLLRHVLQVDADARPGAEPSAHRVDQHVGRLEVRRRVRMACSASARARRARRLSRGRGAISTSGCFERPPPRRLHAAAGSPACLR